MNRPLVRCPWCLSGELYMKYHDEEWGVPVHDDLKQFEFLTLESAQAGLSWITILKKRENYRAAFSGFDPEKVARYTPKKIASLLNDPLIVRTRLKIEAAVNNAQKFLEVQNEFGTFCDYLWNFVDGRPLVNAWKKMEDVPPNTELSDKVSKDLKERGFKFVGSTIVYSHMQAVGLVNDHLTSCFRYRKVG